MTSNNTLQYRNDISGIRAIAVISVILFHMGYLKNGYLGVDIFFVISGFLIINLIYKETYKNIFTIFSFYIRRIRRIIPLVLFTSLISLLLGIFVMLPDDLENLAESVIATNFFANNILLLITSVNYWSSVNEFKPLMHTWSLGVEEQFYLIIPFLFIFLKGKFNKVIFPILLFSSFLSFVSFIISTNESSTFYLLQYRFFELSLGGIAAIFSNKLKIKPTYSFIFLTLIIAILFFNFNLQPKIKILFIIFLTIGLLITPNANKINNLILENKYAVYIGLISFSLYMWHQVVFAFTKYCFINTPNIFQYIILLIIILCLSIFSYKFIENPFRNVNIISNKIFILILLPFFIFIISVASFIYLNMGIVRNIPELDIYKYNLSRNFFGSIINDDNSYKKKEQIYNERILKYNKNFSEKNNIKILIIGNSFSRDFANILLESDLKNKIEISYTNNINNCNNFILKNNLANFILFDDLDYEEYIEIEKIHKIKYNKVRIIGIKNFGINNGVFYSRRFFDDYYLQKTNIDPSIINRNNNLNNIYKKSYINLINLVIDEKGKMPIFTPNHKFISHDGMHLTQSGAIYFANKLDLNTIFKSNLHLN
jgi:peptidoglycan/LPS O-acetylase OafA/YrhL